MGIGLEDKAHALEGGQDIEQGGKETQRKTGRQQEGQEDSRALFSFVCSERPQPIFFSVCWNVTSIPSETPSRHRSIRMRMCGYGSTVTANTLQKCIIRRHAAPLSKTRVHLHKDSASLPLGRAILLSRPPATRSRQCCSLQESGTLIDVLMLPKRGGPRGSDGRGMRDLPQMPSKERSSTGGLSRRHGRHLACQRHEGENEQQLTLAARMSSLAVTCFTAQPSKRERVLVSQIHLFIHVVVRFGDSNPGDPSKS